MTRTDGLCGQQWKMIERTNTQHQQYDTKDTDGFVPVNEATTMSIEFPKVSATMANEAVGVHLNQCGWHSQQRQRRLAGVDLNTGQAVYGR
jgi:hypothetical protein